MNLVIIIITGWGEKFEMVVGWGDRYATEMNSSANVER